MLLPDDINRIRYGIRKHIRKKLKGICQNPKYHIIKKDAMDFLDVTDKITSRISEENMTMLDKEKANDFMRKVKIEVNEEIAEFLLKVGYVCPVCGQVNTDYELKQNLGDCYNCNSELRKDNLDA